MRTFPDSRLLSTSGAFNGEMLVSQLHASRKKRRYAYLAWLCLGSHYLYLRRPVVQALFWLTLGGLLVWWVADLFRIPALVERQNHRTSGDLLEAWHQSIQTRSHGSETTMPWPIPARPSSENAQTRMVAEIAQPQHGEPEHPLPRDGSRRSLKAGAGTVLVAALVVTLAIYALTPPPLHSRLLLEPSFVTLRQVNVRASPSISSPIRAVARKNVILKGQVEEIGGTRWLWVTRGSHSDGYVALRNLEKR
ncbi:hypothetical protein [Allosphingosinicella sp.]|uniref:hypothetical protein n=1 Tax=Allosphingosinicella sp. TaxID=2823234 RepID=UPI003D7595BB